MEGKGGRGGGEEGDAPPSTAFVLAAAPRAPSLSSAGVWAGQLQPRSQRTESAAAAIPVGACQTLSGEGRRRNRPDRRAPRPPRRPRPNKHPPPPSAAGAHRAAAHAARHARGWWGESCFHETQSLPPPPPPTSRACAREGGGCGVRVPQHLSPPGPRHTPPPPRSLVPVPLRHTLDGRAGHEQEPFSVCARHETRTSESPNAPRGHAPPPSRSAPYSLERRFLSREIDTLHRCIAGTVA